MNCLGLELGGLEGEDALFIGWGIYMNKGIIIECSTDVIFKLRCHCTQAYWGFRIARHPSDQ